MNRLRLNWELSTALERNNFLNTYLDSEEFKKRPLSDEEAETCATYVLWGKDPDGKNGDQKGIYELERKRSSWKKAQSSDKIKSLDELMENPAWNENEIISPNQPVSKIPREVFSRSETRKKAPAHLLANFEVLWKEIDRLELTLNFYDLAHDKRKNPPREELLKRFSEEEIESFKRRGTELPQYTYLKLRHDLVEKRQLQYIMKDSFSETVLPHSNPTPYTPADPPTFGNEIPVYPMGLLQDHPAFFKPFSVMVPGSFGPDEQSQLSKYLWTGPEIVSPYYFDFTNLDHVYNLLLQFSDLEEENFERLEDRSLFKTLNFYIENAEFDEVQSLILDLKIKKTPNQKIADIVNPKFNKSYTANYISTIFRQKIIPQINDAAVFHKTLLENIFFPENFKPCTSCGRLLLRDSHYFVRKTRTKDGFSNRCKVCDKLDREKKKEVYNGETTT